METTLDDLNNWAAENQYGQTGPPNIPFDPKTQVTIDSLHAKLRIVGKLIEQLTEEEEEEANCTPRSRNGCS